MAIVLNSDCLTYISTPIQNNFQYKKQEPSPISLVRATRIFSKAKTLKRKMICHWTFEKKEKEVFFRLTTFFFRNKNFLSKEQLLFSFLCIVKQKKISEQSEKNIFENFLYIFRKKFQNFFFRIAPNFFLLHNT